MKIASTLLLAICFLTVGCEKSAPVPVAETPLDPVVEIDGPPPEGDVHDHPDHGPHGGELIELGNEAYHGEIVHNDKGVSIYVLDGAATGGVQVSAKSLTLSLKHDGEVKAFDLAAESIDDEGSKFSSTDGTLVEWLEHGAEGAVVIEIEGKSYTGKISHDHDHDDHGDHDHGPDDHDH